MASEKITAIIDSVKELSVLELKELIELMHHDKKNQNGIINFTMLGGSIQFQRPFSGDREHPIIEVAGCPVIFTDVVQ